MGYTPLQWCPRLPPHVGVNAGEPMLTAGPVLPLTRAARSRRPLTACAVEESWVRARWAMDHLRKLT